MPGREAEMAFGSRERKMALKITDALLKLKKEKKHSLSLYCFHPQKINFNEIMTLPFK